MPEQGSVDKNSMKRRDFLKLLGAAGVALAFTPFVDWGKYMPNPQNANLGRAQVILPDGTRANVNTFPINHAEVITYPTTGDPVLDKEAFRKWVLIRLPAELGGGVSDVTAFRAYSNVCLHLWCLWKYIPVTQKGGNNKGQCPCHASTYDPLTGKAVDGPASLQAPPSNVLPILFLETDKDGNLWIKPATWDVHKNGIVGYGRSLTT
jgi:Rieske Fe-S protein